MMKTASHSVQALLLVTLIMLLFGCSQQNAKVTPEPDQNIQEYKKYFELVLYTDKQTYKTTDTIRIWATLEYTGEGNEVRIWHAIPYISFLISDGKRFNTGGTFDDILTSTILEKGKVYQYQYEKNGGFDAKDPDAAFWRKFYAEKELRLPVGEYEVTARGDFSLSMDDVGEKNNLNETVRISVTK